MKKVIIAIVIVVVCSMGFTFDGGGKLPTVVIKNLDGSKVSTSTFTNNGKPIIISFWATWCVPCTKEIKNISLKLPEWKKEADFNYMTVSIDEPRAEGLVRTYALSQGWSFPFYLDANSDLKRSLSFQNVPYTMIIDKNGKVAFTHTGYEEGGEAEVFAKIKELAAAK